MSRWPRVTSDTGRRPESLRRGRLSAGLAAVLSGVLALSSWMTGSSYAQSTSGITVLRVEPLYGHAGDTIYISGSGFEKNSNLAITMACPRVFSPAAYGNTQTWGPAGGPRTNRSGNFIDYPIHAVRLTGMTASVCTIYASNGPNPFAVDVPLTYLIVSPGSPLPWSATHVTATVHASPARVHGGQLETVTFSQGWPGAQATVTLRYGAFTVTKTVRLNWDGYASTQWRLGHVFGSVPAHVSAVMRFGRYRGNATAKFTVLR